MDAQTQFWVTTAAIIIGPLAAVLISTWLDRRRAGTDRRQAVFRSLMKTRRNWGSIEHVEALNLIEVEFHGRTKVLGAYRQLFDYFVNDIARRSDENDDQYATRKNTHHSTLLTALLKAIADDLGYHKDALEIMQGGYSPIMHGEIESDQTKIRKLLAGLHDGTMVLPTAVVDVRHPEKILDQARQTQLLLEHAQKLEADENSKKAPVKE
jgi:hypothetical protein